jgi:hypothetical protein
VQKKKERGSSFGGALLLKPHEAVGDGGGNGGWETAAAKLWVWARQQPLLSKGSRHGLGAVRAVRLTLGAHVVLYFS